MLLYKMDTEKKGGQLVANWYISILLQVTPPFCMVVLIYRLLSLFLSTFSFVFKKK